VRCDSMSEILKWVFGILRNEQAENIKHSLPAFCI